MCFDGALQKHYMKSSRWWVLAQARHSVGQASCCCTKCWHTDIMATVNLPWETETQRDVLRGRLLGCNRLRGCKFHNTDTRSNTDTNAHISTCTCRRFNERRSYTKVVTLAALITVVRLLIIVVIIVLQLQNTRDTLRGGAMFYVSTRADIERSLRVFLSQLFQPHLFVSNEVLAQSTDRTWQQAWFWRESSRL